ncbi:MAG: hypothetical protein PGN23_04670 [Sphingomonas adhaesiva]|uniref:hypothetical protein n=1 Tax=Sphingomonas adhaesiva TaxID=28212 RepID=UPI002FF839D0
MLPERFRLPLAVLLTGALTATAAAAQTYVVHQISPTQQPRGMQSIHLSKVSTDGQKIRLWMSTMVNPDCTPSGTITSALIDTPRHGRADIVDDAVFPNYMPPNPRVACDRVKVPGKVVYYTPDPGFRGHDHVVFQNANSDGYVRRISADIDVR